MVSSEVIAVGRRRAAIAMDDRRREFSAQIRRVESGEIARGMYHSGVAQGKLSDAIRSEFEARAIALWKVFDEVVDSRAFAQDPELGPQLKEVVSELLDSNSDDVRKCHQKVERIMGSAGHMVSLEDCRTGALARVYSDMDVALLEYCRPEDSGRDTDVLQLKPSFYGLGIDLKALWRRVRRRKT